MKFHRFDSQSLVVRPIGLLLLLVFLSCLPGMAQVKVTVVNPLSKPVPVQVTGTVPVTGSVNVANTPNVNLVNVPTVALASGTAVSLTGTPTVQCSNTAAAPIFTKNVAEPARQPIQLTDHFAIPANNFIGQTTFNNFVVPNGKELVIEYIDAVASPGLATTVMDDFGLKNTVGGTSANHMFDAPRSPSGKGFRTAQQVRLYADPGTSIVFFAESDSFITNPADIFVNLSGYLVDVP